MKTVIPAWSVFRNWIVTVLAGSIIWPICMGVPHPFAMFISFIFSGLWSLPALGIFFLVNAMLNKTPAYSLRKSLIIHNGIHLMVAAVTFSVFDILVRHESEVISLIGSVYTVIGLFVWNYSYWKRAKALETVALENTSELTDKTENT